MSTFRVVWDFNENQGTTFSEVYYKSADTPQAAAVVPTALQLARTNLLHPLNVFKRVRVTNADAQRETFPRLLNLVGTLNVDSGPLPPGAAIFCSLTGSAGGSRKLALRGSAQSFYLRSATTGRDVVLPGLDEALKEFFKQLKTAGYGLRKLSPIQTSPLSVYSKNPITSVNGTAANGTSVLTFKNPLVYAAGSRVVIAQVNKKELPSLNGHFPVLDTAGQTITIPYRTPSDATVTTAGGYVRKESYSEVSVFVPGSCDFDHFGTRDTKSPLSNSRGARRAARIRLSR
jgi:hypothetical protein